MQQIDAMAVQSRLEQYAGKEVYLHLEMTTGVYAAHRDNTKMTAGTFIRNGLVPIVSGALAGKGPYRAGLKTATGWVYADGLTHWEPSETDRLLLAGHDQEGRLVVALELGLEPFGDHAKEEC